MGSNRANRHVCRKCGEAQNLRADDRSCAKCGGLLVRAGNQNQAKKDAKAKADLRAHGAKP